MIMGALDCEGSLIKGASQAYKDHSICLPLAIYLLSLLTKKTHQVMKKPKEKRSYIFIFKTGVKVALETQF